MPELNPHEITQRAILRSVEIANLNHDSLNATLREMLHQQRQILAAHAEFARRFIQIQQASQQPGDPQP